MNQVTIAPKINTTTIILKSLLIFWLIPLFIKGLPDIAQAEATMETSLGKPMTLNMRTLKKSRGYLYCELVFDYGDKGNDIYTTSHLKECSVEWWDNLDTKKVAQELGAKTVYKNGPQWWAMDEVGQMGAEPVTIGGVDMTFGAHLPVGTLNISKYVVFNPAKYQNLVYQAGKPVYQLVDSDGHVYVLQGNKVGEKALASLGDKFQQLPDGWEYRITVLDKDLVMNLTPKEPIPSVQDEFDQIYIRIPK